jgi:hypothetical protein
VPLFCLVDNHHVLYDQYDVVGRGVVLFSGQSDCCADVLDLAKWHFVDLALRGGFEEVRHGPELVAVCCCMVDSAVAQGCIGKDGMDGDEARRADPHRRQELRA